MYSTEHNWAGFVIAGGRSTRMGRDKAFLDFKGESLLTHALRVMSGVCGTVKIVGDPAKFSAASFETIADVYAGSGPLGGIHAALLSSRWELNAMLAVDMPYVSTDLLQFLLGRAAEHSAVVTIPRTDGRLQPLCAVYRREFAVPAEEALLTAQFKIEAAFAGVKTRVIEEEELFASGFSARNFLNLNTPQDLDLHAQS